MKKNLVICAVFLLFSAIYIMSVAPAYNSDDSPETTVAFHTLGIQHPPGYPLNTLIGKAFTLMPLGSHMLRANLMSVFFNLLAAFFIFMLVREMAETKNPGWAAVVAGLVAAVFYLFSASPWLQSVSAKGSIYSLNAFMTSAGLWSLMRVKAGIKYFYLFCLIYGLSLGNHWTSMLVIAPGFIFYLFTLRKNISLKGLAVGAVFAMLGAGIYAYVFIRSASHPVYAWGDTKTLNDLLWLISRAQYATAEQKHTIADTMRLLSYYSKNLVFREYPLFLSLLFIPGAVFLFRRKRNEATAMIISLICLVLSVASVATPPKNTEWLIKPYLVSANIFIAIFSSLFLFYAARKISEKNKTLLLAAVSAVIACAMLVADNPRYERYFVGYDYSRNITITAGEDSIVFTEGDMNIGAILYETLVQKKKYVPLIPVVMQYEWYRNQVRSNYPGMFVLPENSPDMKAYIAGVIASNRDKNIFYSNVYTEQWLAGLTYYPEGLLFRIRESPVTRPVSDMFLRLYSYRGLLEDKTGYDEFTRRLVLENYCGAFNAFAETLRKAGQLEGAVKFFNYALLFNANTGAIINMGLAYYYLNDMDGAAGAWQKVIDLEPGNPLPYINMAFIYVSKNQVKTAIEYLDRALKADPYNSTAMKMKSDLEKQGGI